LLQGVVKFIIIRTQFRVECIKVMNCHLGWLIRTCPQNSPYSSYIGSGKGGEGSALYQLGSLDKGRIVMYGKPRLTSMGMT
jgi:hypothetical protein